MTRVLTPSSLPDDVIVRTLEIPSSQEWLGVFNFLLLQGTKLSTWEQLNDTDLDAQQCADAVYAVYERYLSSEGNLVITDLRTSGGQLQIERDNSGTWEDVPDADYVRVDGSVDMTDALTINTQVDNGLTIERVGDHPVAVRLQNDSDVTADWSILLDQTTRNLVAKNSAGNKPFWIVPTADNGLVQVRATTLDIARVVVGNGSHPSVLVLHRTGGAAPGAGYGVGLTFRAEPTNGGSDVAMALIYSRYLSAGASWKAGLNIDVADSVAQRTAIALGTDGTQALFAVLGAAASPRLTLTGSRGGNAAVASIIAALVAFGFVVDSTSA